MNSKIYFLQNIGKVSKVAKSMAMWVIAMDEFSKVYKEVEPKIKKASEAEAILKEVNSFIFTVQFTSNKCFQSIVR